MKSVSAIIASAAVVAAADSYGAYNAQSSSQLAYTTVHPGYGHEAVTVTKQHQPVPTYVDGKSSEYLYVSTVIPGYDGKSVTVTKTDQDVTLYSTKATITHTKTEPAQGYASPTGAYPTADGYYPKQNGTVKVYYELYEKIYEAEYKQLGPKAIPGYGGSSLYRGDKDKQPVHIKEFKGGKWSTWKNVLDYGVPKPSAKTFAAPGTYTIPAYEKTVTKSYTATFDAQFTAPAHQPVTYGGITATVTKATTVTVTVPHVKTNGPKPHTVYSTKTVTCPKAGEYEVEKPTTTSFDKPTTFSYPTITVYPPGVYHHTKETVTITKSNAEYTCKYQSTEKPRDTYPEATVSVTKGSDSYPTATASASETDSYETPSATSPHGADPSSDYDEPVEYGTPYAGYVRRGGMLERREKAEPQVKRTPAGKRVILI